MSVSPTNSDSGSEYSTGSDFEISWPDFDNLSIGETPFSEQVSAENQADSQLQLLRSKEDSGELADKPSARQILFFSTIYILAGEQRYDQAETILIEADTKGVWEGYAAQRAQAYTYLIEQNLEKGVHDKANGLYSRALGLLVWEGCVTQKDSAKQALTQAGYHIS